MPKTQNFLRSRIFIAIIGLVAILIAFRIALPHYILNYVNRTLKQMEDYKGHVRDIRVHLWRGAYEIIELKLVKTTGDVPVPLINVKRIDLSVQWSELIHGAAVGRMTFIEPQLNIFTNFKVVNWKEDIKNPLKLAWKAIVGAVATILKNKPTGRIATNVPIKGNFEKKDVDYWIAIGNLLRNAFIQAIRPGFQAGPVGSKKSEEGTQKSKGK